MGYMINFIVYTIAMVGIIFLAVFVYKKFSFCAGTKSKFLNVEDCISIGPRKELFVVRAGNERFLVASDVGRTSLISKLNSNSNYVEEVKEFQNFKEVKEVAQASYNQSRVNNPKSILNTPKREQTSSVDDLPEIVSLSKQNRPTMVNRQPKKVFKNIVNNI